MTNPTLLAPFLLFSVLMTVTPGPNNAMALASGARIGLRGSTPLICGIAAGIALQMLAAGLGLGTLFTAYPASHDVLRVGGSLYLVWLAWRIARSGPVAADHAGRPPLGFVSAAAFQWINPKAWAITAGAAAAYVPQDGYMTNVAVASLVLALVAIPCVGLWAAVGSSLRGLLARPSYARIFNLIVAALLVATTVPMLVDVGQR